MRPTLDAAALTPGDRLPACEKAFSTVDLVAYGAATWDWHRLHYDLAYAQARKLPNVIIDGQMYGALFARQALDWAGPRAFIARMNVRMRSMAFAGDTLRGEAEVSEVRAGDGHHVVVVAQRLLNGERLVAECTTELRLPH
jgi:acyl dehydratase